MITESETLWSKSGTAIPVYGTADAALGELTVGAVPFPLAAGIEAVPEAVAPIAPATLLLAELVVAAGGGT